MTGGKYNETHIKPGPSYVDIVPTCFLIYPCRFLSSDREHPRGFGGDDILSGIDLVVEELIP